MTIKIRIVAFLALVSIGYTCGATSDMQRDKETADWTFASMPDFLNVDTDYPQPGWENSLDYILRAIKAEDPEFLLVAGDLVMGEWPSAEKIEKYAERYYSAWIERMNAHDLKFYVALGDHEIGDDPWPPQKAKLVPLFKHAFREHLQMPLNGPPSMQGTAFYLRQRDTLIVAVDIFEQTKPGGAVHAQVTGEQLEWLRKVLKEHEGAKHKIVMGHTPILGPVRRWSSSGLMLKGGRGSPLWQTMKEFGVDIYLCGEQHAITCIERDGILQIAHGGLIGYNTRTNYLLARVFPDRIELELKEIEMRPEGDRLWQVGDNRPLERVVIPETIKQQGFTTVGRATLLEEDGKKTLRNATGYFMKEHEPEQPERYFPVFSNREGSEGPPKLEEGE